MQERRRYERVTFLCKLSVAALPDGPKLEASSIDISLGGVQFASLASFQLGQPVAITFHIRGPGHEVQEQAVGRVTRLQCSPEANCIGVEFLMPLQRAMNPQLVQVIERI